MARLLQISLSEKISEKVVAMQESGGGGGGGGGKTAAGGSGGEEGGEYSPSPVSTISSSGDAEGVYTLYTDEESGSSSEGGGGEGRGEEEEDEGTGEMSCEGHVIIRLFLHIQVVMCY